MTTWADDAAAALEALGDSPTPDQARAVTDRYPNVDVLAALAARGGGGGASPVSCYLKAASFSVTGVSSHPTLWTNLYDDPWNSNSLSAIPDGLGMAFVYDGSDATITTTEAGVWSLTFHATADGASFAGIFRDSFMVTAPFVYDTTSDVSHSTIGAVYSMPDETQFGPEIVTRSDPGASKFGTVDLVIVRLG